MKNMEEIRQDVRERALMLMRVLKFCNDADRYLNYAITDADEYVIPGEAQIRLLSRQLSTASGVNQLVIGQVEERLNEHLSQLGFLIARDVIAPVARESKEPIAWLTGNSYMPPLRSLHEVEEIWKEANGDQWEMFVESIESKLAAEFIYMAQPDYDNALYVVDLKRWQYKEDSLNPDDLSGEWEPVGS